MRFEPLDGGLSYGLLSQPNQCAQTTGSGFLSQALQMSSDGADADLQSAGDGIWALILQQG